MSGDEVRELAAVYALGALDGEDRARFEALLQAGDRTAVDALAEFEATIVDLAAESRATPPAHVKATLMDRVAQAQSRTASPVSPAPRARRWWPFAWAAAMAATVAAAIVGLTVADSYQRHLDDMNRQLAKLKIELARREAEVTQLREIKALLSDPSTQRVALAGLKPAPAARADMIWNAATGGLFEASGLPAVPPGKTYQLWAIAGKGLPVSAGVFSVDERGDASLRVAPLEGVRRVDLFAVTLEPAGGLPAPSGEMFLAGKS